jgi:hypothetical protein
MHIHWGARVQKMYFLMYIEKIESTLQAKAGK